MMNSERYSKHLSERDFSRLSRFIHSQFGILMPPVKKSLLEGRLSKRMKHWGIDSYSEYCDFLFTDKGMSEELVSMIDAVTTNKTEFFREPHHFEFMIRQALPELIRKKRFTSQKNIRVWSAACSTGEEPYSLAMTLNEFALDCPGFDYSILATDISTKVLRVASDAVYHEEKVNPVPFDLKRKYLLKSRDPSKHIVRIVPELRSRVTFRRFNLIEGRKPLPDPIDIIFCRNVMIYFDANTQKKLIHTFHDLLSPGGYLFIGHAETLGNCDAPLSYVAPTVYRKDG